MASYTRTALKGASIFFVMSIFAGFIAYLVRLVLARNLTKADYGLFYAVFTLFAMLSLFRDLGLGQALIKYISEFNINRKYALIKGSIIITFLSQVIASLAIVFAIFIFSKQISLHFFHTADSLVVMFLLAVMFILMPAEKIFSFTFQGFKRFDYNSLIEFTRMGIVLVFISVYFRYDVSVIVPCLAYIASYIGESILFFILFLRTFPAFFRVKAVLSKALSKKLFLFGLPVMIGLVGSMIITYIDTLAITYFRTLEEVALYQVAMPTAKLLLYFTTAVSMVVLPMSSELWARKLKKKLIAGIDLLYRYSFVFIIPLALLMFTFPEIIIRVFFGQKYADASFVLQILALAGIIYTVAFINSNVLSGIGRPKENTKIILLAAIFNLVLDIILVPFAGISGAAIATLLSYLMMLLLTGIKIKSIMEIHAPWAYWLKNLLAAAVFVVFMYCMKGMINVFGDITEMAIVGFSGGVIYILLLIILGVVDLKEIKGITAYALKK